MQYSIKRFVVKSLFFAFGFIFLSCGKVPTSEPNAAVESFSADFENASLANFHFLVPDTAFNTTIVTSPLRKGKYALKNVLRPDDFINNGYRAELAVYDCAKYKTEVYYAFSFWIDTAYADPAYNLLCQWQDLPYYIQGEWWGPTPLLRGSSPPLALVYANGALDVKMNENPSSNQEVVTVSSVPALPKGQWHDVIFHCYWSDDNSAFVEVKLNGEFITPFNGNDYKYYKRNLFNRTGNYFKFGQYRGKEKTKHTNIVYFDELKIASTYNAVAP